MPVLLEKIRVILRRRGVETEPRRLRYRDLVLDLDAREVLAAGRPLELTAREFDLLHTLVRADVYKRQRQWKPWHKCTISRPDC